MKCLVLFIALVFASEQNTENAEELFGQNGNAPILVKIEEDEYAKIKKKKTSQYIGVTYNQNRSTWAAYRHTKNENKTFNNGSYKNEERAAHASDTLARKLMANGEHHKLNFPEDDTEVNPESTITSSKYIGVSYDIDSSKWLAKRWSKNDKKQLYNGNYKDEETAARASDTLARKLMANGEHHKLNFPEDDTEVNPESTITSSKYIGVSYDIDSSKWRAKRWSKNDKKQLYNGNYKDEEIAAHASDTLARKLMANGEQKHKINFPDDGTEVCAEKVRKNKRKRPKDLNASQADRNFKKFE